jgi:hypothetical protein
MSFLLRRPDGALVELPEDQVGILIGNDGTAGYVVTPAAAALVMAAGDTRGDTPSRPATWGEGRSDAET